MHISNHQKQITTVFIIDAGFSMAAGLPEKSSCKTVDLNKESVIRNFRIAAIDAADSVTQSNSLIVQSHLINHFGSFTEYVQIG